ncbi:MAG TPA: exopolysaccharide biosynthesis polyprenyl glycosylphosphotransferase [Stellaceae bacterium]|nr:exopolysaccharide biosynthesis polyprenyl glycosylphosphotransferase [Stellaceae bacterium]
MSAQERLSVTPAFQLRLDVRRIVLVGRGDHVRRLANRITASRNLLTEVVRIVQPAGEGDGDALAAQLTPEVLQREQVWALVVASDLIRLLPAALLLQCRLNGIRVLDEGSFWERVARCIDLDGATPSWLLSGGGFRYGPLETFVKRLFDLVVAVVLILLTLPLMLVVAMLIRCESRGPILYRQERVGRRGEVFVLFKFRSMYEDAEAGGAPVWAAKGDARITRVGRFIRYTRVDELPQLWNVLRGEMSVVGPRPERPYFVERLAAAIPLYAERHFVKPGITGWAQVKAPYGASFEDAREKLRYDLYYIKNRTLAFDLRILMATIRVVLWQEGAR